MLKQIFSEEQWDLINFNVFMWENLCKSSSILKEVKKSAHISWMSWMIVIYEGLRYGKQQLNQPWNKPKLASWEHFSSFSSFFMQSNPDVLSYSVSMEMRPDVDLSCHISTDVHNETLLVWNSSDPADGGSDCWLRGWIETVRDRSKSGRRKG